MTHTLQVAVYCVVRVEVVKAFRHAPQLEYSTLEQGGGQ